VKLVGEMGGTAEDLLFPGLNAADIFFTQAEVDELEAVLAVRAEGFRQAGGSALGGGGRVVELVGKVSGELAERGEFLGLLLDAGYLAYAVEQCGDHALGHGGDGLKHLREVGFGVEQRPDRRDSEALAAVGFHA
jgi:hypothetical protein